MIFSGIKNATADVFLLNIFVQRINSFSDVGFCVPALQAPKIRWAFDIFAAVCRCKSYIALFSELTHVVVISIIENGNNRNQPSAPSPYVLLSPACLNIHHPLQLKEE